MARNPYHLHLPPTHKIPDERIASLLRLKNRGSDLSEAVVIIGYEVLGRGGEGTGGRCQLTIIGPAYRSLFAKDGLPPPVPGIDSCWDVFRLSAERNPGNRILGRREVVDGKGGRCGIYGANCPEWVISMETCNAHGIYCIPLYDTLGVGAVEFILSHAEVQIIFVDEKKIVELLKTFPNATKFLKIIVSFGNISPVQKEEFGQFGSRAYLMAIDVMYSSISRRRR